MSLGKSFKRMYAEAMGIKVVQREPKMDNEEVVELSADGQTGREAKRQVVSPEERRAMREARDNEYRREVEESGDYKNQRAINRLKEEMEKKLKGSEEKTVEWIRDLKIDLERRTETEKPQAMKVVEAKHSSDKLKDIKDELSLLLGIKGEEEEVNIDDRKELERVIRNHNIFTLYKWYNEAVRRNAQYAEFIILPELIYMLMDRFMPAVMRLMEYADVADKERLGLADEASKLSESLKISEKEHARLTDETSKLSESFEAMKKERSGLADELTKISETFKVLEKERNGLKDEVGKLLEKIKAEDRLVEKIDKLSEYIEAMKKERTQLAKDDNTPMSREKSSDDKIVPVIVDKTVEKTESKELSPQPQMKYPELSASAKTVIEVLYDLITKGKLKRNQFSSRTTQLCQREKCEDEYGRIKKVVKSSLQYQHWHGSNANSSAAAVRQ